MDKPFSVALVDAGDMPAAQRISAEVRFVREIEKVLGGSDQVAQVYRAWLEASESEASELNKEMAALAVRWPKASEAAHRAGFREIGDVGEAHFEVRLHRVTADQ